MSTTATETVTVASDVRANDLILVEAHAGPEWTKVRAVSHRAGLALIVRADGHLMKYADSRSVFVRR